MLLAAAASPLLGHPSWGPKLVPQLCQTIADAGTSARHVSPILHRYEHVQFVPTADAMHEITTKHEMKLPPSLCLYFCDGGTLAALQFLTVWWAEFEPQLLEAAVVQPLQVRNHNHHRETRRPNPVHLAKPSRHVGVLHHCLHALCGCRNLQTPIDKP